MMDLRDLEVLVEVVEAGSLAAAARRLNIAPMAASRRLAALETELGVRLVHRTTRSLSLTAEGEALLPYAQRMLESEADGRAAVLPRQAPVSGLLRITASVPFGRLVVTPAIAAFLRAHPNASVDLMLTDSVIDIVAHGIDVAIRIGTLRDSSLVAQKLGDNPRFLYASPDYLADRGTPTKIAELAAHSCLTLSGMSDWDFQSNGKTVRRQHVTSRFSATSVDALYQACLEGVGIAVLPTWEASAGMSAGRLRKIDLVDGSPEPLRIWSVYPTARFIPPKVRAFVEILQSLIGSEAY